jgi:hypothetical protein
MRQFSKVIISLDGVSSEIKDKEAIKKNIAMALRAIGLPFEYYQTNTDGFAKLEEDMNQPDTLYLCNDSLPYHLCHKPCILLARSWPWIESNPKPNCIGMLTHEMLATEYGELIGIIARNQPMRQHSDLLAAHTYLLFSQHFPSTSEAMGRYAGAQVTWATLRQKDVHVRYLPYASEGLPFVSDMLCEGIAQTDHVDDIIILLNSDILLVPEATAIIRAFMDSRNIEACYSCRIDTAYNKNHTFKELQEFMPHVGMDLFAFRPNSEIAQKLIKIPLYLGREGWDSAWASLVKHRLPWSVSYHWQHNSEWHSQSEENEFNRAQIKKHFGLGSAFLGVGIGYEPQY